MSDRTRRRGGSAFATRLLGVSLLISPALLLWGCDGPQCHADNLSGQSNPTRVEGCCEPGSQLAPDELDGNPSSACSCPLTGNDVEGTAICSASGDGYECDGCPAPYVEGNPCNGERVLACQVVASEQSGSGDAPVMLCENGTWTYAFTCDVNCGNLPTNPDSVWCGETIAVEGSWCDRQDSSACSPDRSALLRCRQDAWTTHEACPAGAQCEKRDGAFGCY